MKKTITVPFKPEKKYLALPVEFRGSSMIVDLMSSLVQSLSHYGELQTFRGTIIGGSSFQTVKIPGVLAIHLTENPQEQTIVLEYEVLIKNNRLVQIVDQLMSDFSGEDAVASVIQS